MTSNASHPTIALCSATLHDVHARGVAIPTYDRSTLVPRIVHLGVGGFHRAHLALYCDMLAAKGGDWGICGVGLLASDATMASVMADQDHLYTLTAKGNIFAPKITNHPELDPFVKEPAREGWNMGEDLWKQG